MRYSSILFATLTTLLLAACDEPTSRDGDYLECVDKGTRYFQSIGSYPYLSNGEDAVEVAMRRCRRTAGAFDGLD